MNKLDKEQREWAMQQAEVTFQIAIEGEWAYEQDVNGHKVEVEFIEKFLNEKGQQIINAIYTDYVSAMEEDISYFMQGTKLSYKPEHGDYAQNQIAICVAKAWAKENPSKCVPSTTFRIGNLTLSGNLNELKELSEEIGNLAKESGNDLSKSLNDGLFSIDAEYQAYHELDQDNWDIVH